MVGKHAGRVLDIGGQSHARLPSHRAPASMHGEWYAKPPVTAVGLLGVRVTTLEAASVVATR